MKSNTVLIIIVVVSLILIVLLIIRNKKVLNAESGGLLYGKLHSEGGIKGFEKHDAQLLEFENGEAIINRDTILIKDKYVCEGTPSEIASKLNEIGKGVAFDNNGKCIKK